MAQQGVNKAIIIGNLGKDPEVRFMPSGEAVANLTIATSESWKDKQTGEKKEKTEWHRVSIFGKLAEIAGEYLKKGSKVYIEGKLQTRKWTNSDGHDQYTTEIVLQGYGGVMQMLGGNDQQGAPQQAPQQQSNGFQQQAPAQQQQQGYVPQQQMAGQPVNNNFQQQAPQQAATNQSQPQVGFDSDIPF